jgi:hypothetical protein
VRTRVGIELNPAVCRVVEVANPRLLGHRYSGDTVVRSFAVCPATGTEADNLRVSLRGKTASVVVWGAASEHCQVEVIPGRYEEMRSEALRTLDGAGVPTAGAWADIAPAGPSQGPRRRVVLAMAEPDAMREAVRPLLEAGVRVASVMTPAAALAALARSRRSVFAQDLLESYVALEERGTCVTLLAGGALVAARELPWGFLDAPGEDAGYREQDAIVTRLGDDLADFFAAHADTGRVSQVCICGGLPELRSTTLPLMERFEAEVETLDSLVGIDDQRLPDPADEFRGRASELRLAWAAAADWSTINLLRPRRRQASQLALSYAAVVAGVAFGSIGSWTLARGGVSDVPDSNHAPRVALATGASVPPAHEPRHATPEPSVTPVETQAPLAPSFARESPADAPASAMMRSSPVGQDLLPREPVPPRDAPSIAQNVLSALNAPPKAPEIKREPPSIRQEPAVPPMPPPVIRQEPSAVRHVSSPVRAVRPPQIEEIQPLEAQISGILVSPDRQLAIVDGRVVGLGDEVRGAVVVEISSSSVLVRDSGGRLRRLTSGGGTR